LVAYATGQTDTFKGTGVYSGIEFSRDKEEEGKPADEKKKKDDAPTKSG